ncbi:hypothetical protein K503DRAFT_772192, partial [Rhizopogon vinicolor AM-OR11-026]
MRIRSGPSEKYAPQAAFFDAYKGPFRGGFYVMGNYPERPYLLSFRKSQARASEVRPTQVYREPV